MHSLFGLILGCGANLIRIQPNLGDEAITAGFAWGHRDAAVAVAGAFADRVRHTRIWTDETAERFGFVFTKAGADGAPAASGAEAGGRFRGITQASNHSHGFSFLLNSQNS